MGNIQSERQQRARAAVIQLLRRKRYCRWRDLKNIAKAHGVKAYWASKKLRRIGVIRRVRGKRGLYELT
jgi:hypothetical protein